MCTKFSIARTEALNQLSAAYAAQAARLAEINKEITLALEDEPTERVKSLVDIQATRDLTIRVVAFVEMLEEVLKGNPLDMRFILHELVDAALCLGRLLPESRMAAARRRIHEMKTPRKKLADKRRDAAKTVAFMAELELHPKWMKQKDSIVATNMLQGLNVRLEDAGLKKMSHGTVRQRLMRMRAKVYD